MRWCGRPREAYGRSFVARTDIAGDEGVCGARGEIVTVADAVENGAHLAAVRAIGEVGVGEAVVVVGCEVGEVLANEAHPGGTRARLQKERVGGQEAGAGGSCAGGNLVDGVFGVIDAGQQGRAEDAGGDAGLPQLADGGEAEVGAGRAGFEFAGEGGVRGGDGEVNDQRIARGDAPQQVDVAGDEVGLGGDAESVALAAANDLEKATGEAGAALDRLVRIGGGAEGDLLAGVNAIDLLFKEPGGVLLEVDFALEGPGPGLFGAFMVAGGRVGDLAGLKELVGVAGVAVAAGELAATVGVDGPLEGEVAFAERAVEEGLGAHSAKGDEVAVCGVVGLGGEAGHPDGLGGEDGKEGWGWLGYHIRHFFASVDTKVGHVSTWVNCFFCTADRLRVCRSTYMR